jgi:hypothetical protein
MHIVVINCGAVMGWNRSAMNNFPTVLMMKKNFKNKNLGKIFLVLNGLESCLGCCPTL